MDIAHYALLLGLLLPLAMDTFVLSAALGLAGLPKAQRLRTSLVLAAFEAGMPVVGLLVGHGFGRFLGRFAGYTAALVIGFAGVLLLRADEDDKEQERLRLLAHARGFAVVDLALSISVDELALGVSLGLLRVPLLFAVVYLAVQSFATAQLGFWLGERLSEKLREGAERIAGVILVAVAAALILLKLTGHEM